ncbi:MAG: hypothetical protein ACRDL7_07155 [Gaiellaceae bacterium]
MKRGPTIALERGDFCWLSTRDLPMRGTALPKKLQPRFIGPFEVVRRVGEVDYQLQLPGFMGVHDVFHVGLLKPYQQPSRLASAMPRVRMMPWEQFLKVHTILHRRLNRVRNAFEYFVHFEDTHPTDDAWISQAELDRFGILALEGTWTLPHWMG